VANDVDDDRLIDDALAGRADAFGQLVARYQDRLFHAMTNISGSVEDARDVVQDAFVQAFLKLEDFRRTSAFYTWLYRIAFNVAVGRRRRAKVTHSLDGDGTIQSAQLADGIAGPGARLEQQETAARVQAALRSLAEEYRTVLVMREIDGCDYETIAEVLDLPVGTVRSRLHRARLQMRELLKEVLEIENE
jgi:RNA polymerase sigma-70 factor (ECF subfamily)